MVQRAAGERGDATQFDEALRTYRTLLDSHDERGMLFNPFTLREIHLRGLLSTRRPAEAVRQLESHRNAIPIAPQWQIIERVTAGEVLFAAGEPAGAEEALRVALTAAEDYRLPHQIQRTIRAAEHAGLDDLVTDGTDALHRLQTLLAPPD